MNNFDSFFDKIYNNRKGLIKYFAVIFFCSVFRAFLTPFLAAVGFAPHSAGLVSWALWGALLYVLLKKLVFKQRLETVYLLLTQIMIYTVCIWVLWFLNSAFVGVFAALLKNATVAMALGGVLIEILCMLIMYKIVFRKK